MGNKTQTTQQTNTLFFVAQTNKALQKPRACFGSCCIDKKCNVCLFWLFLSPHCEGNTSFPFCFTLFSYFRVPERRYKTKHTQHNNQPEFEPIGGGGTQHTLFCLRRLEHTCKHTRPTIPGDPTARSTSVSKCSTSVPTGREREKGTSKRPVKRESPT